MFLLQRMSSDISCKRSKFNQNKLDFLEGLIFSGKKYSCSVCNKAFTRRPTMPSSFKSIHNSVKEYQCDVCRSHGFLKQKLIYSDVSKKTFPCSNALSRHNLLHSGVKEYRCDMCNKVYTLSLIHI